MRLNRILTEKMNKKVLKALRMRKPLFSERKRTLVSVSPIKITLRLTEK